MKRIHTSILLRILQLNLKMPMLVIIKKVITNGDVGLTGSHANNYRLVFDIGTARITPFDIAKAPMIDFRQGRTVTRSYSAENLVAEIEIAPEVLIYYNSTDFFQSYFG
ncbi:hypothetical protein [Lactococcus fujiensis]|uniref:hypothetical protein n=1 Tax=Lactococcus fujiensis TaxID=610251 RepID=UPI0006D037B8|nr:hypothetical protein [Lactococcus fujiensis]